jgi:hypothetical protein
MMRIRCRLLEAGRADDEDLQLSDMVLLPLAEDL